MASADENKLSKPFELVFLALAFSLFVPLLGLVYLGPFYAALFLLGYLGGFAFWMVVRSRAPWRAIHLQYWLTACAFVAHKVEENRMRLFEAVARQITGSALPEVSFGMILALLVIPLGAWLAIPLLVRRDHEIGRFLAWTFFASMALTEAAHFAMPALAQEPYGYFPGMMSALLLVPLGFWGMWRLARPISL